MLFRLGYSDNTQNTVASRVSATDNADESAFRIQDEDEEQEGEEEEDEEEEEKQDTTGNIDEPSPTPSPDSQPEADVLGIDSHDEKQIEVKDVLDNEKDAHPNVEKKQLSEFINEEEEEEEENEPDQPVDIPPSHSNNITDLENLDH